MQAKPILKWAGGKTQLSTTIDERIPEKFKQGSFTYVEPFIGGGAMFFWMKKHYQLEKTVINDINPNLINCYRTVKNDVTNLIDGLEVIQNSYWKLANDKEVKKQFYYNVRQLFNDNQKYDLEKAIHLIFLNKTCFNGLYRVNRKGFFNVPIGSYKKPVICNESNLRIVSEALQDTIILNGDYRKTISHASKNSLFYLDPPYKPISETSNFNAYAKGSFDDEEQIRLSKFCNELSSQNCSWILSNSDVNSDTNPDSFFDELYKDYDIRRVQASRAINSVSSKRGKLNEILISNG